MNIKDLILDWIVFGDSKEKNTIKRIYNCGC